MNSVETAQGAICDNLSRQEFIGSGYLRCALRWAALVLME